MTAPIHKGIFKITDFSLLRILFGFLVVDVALLLVWTFLPQIPGRGMSTATIAGLSIEQVSCNGGSLLGVALLFIYKGAMLLYGAFLSYRTRQSGVQEYSEQRFATGAIVVIGFAAVVIVPLTFTLESGRLLVASLGVLFSSIASSGLYIGQKLLNVGKDTPPGSRRTGTGNASHASTDSSNGNVGSTSL